MKQKKPNLSTENAVTLSSDQEDNSFCHNNFVSKPQPFPEEVLEIIFGFLTDPKDLVNVSKASLQFERILEPSKREWLFVQVLPILYLDLTQQDVLNCRLVCKNWNESVTHLTDNHHEARPFDPELDKNLTPGSRQYHTSLSSERRLEGFVLGLNFMSRGISPKKWLQIMENHRGNPFVVKFVKIYSVDYRFDNEYWKYALKFLRKYGKYIHHIRMLFQERHQDFLTFYKTLRLCLQLMPNLRTLALSRSYNLLDSNDELKDPCISKVKDYVRLHPLPNLPHLSALHLVLEIFNFNASQQRIVKEIFRRYQNQLEKLTIDPLLCLDDPEEYTLNLHFWSAKNITDLTLIENEDSDAGSSLIEFLSNVPQFPNLGKVTIKIMHRSSGHDIHDILEALKRFPTIRILKLWFFFRPEIGDSDSRRQPTFQLPNIKTLDICFRTVYCNNFYDAILCHLSGLQYLSIDQMVRHQNEYLDEEEGDELFQVMEGLRSGKLYKSEIWKRLSCLREISCWKYCLGNHPEKGWDRMADDLVRFTREGYEQLKSSMVK